MANEWNKKCIGDDCKVGDGAHAKIKRQNAGIIYLTSKNLKDGKLDLSKIDFISPSDYERHFNEKSTTLNKPKAGDVLFSIIGSIGEPYLVRPQDIFGLSSSVSMLRANTKIIVPKYLYYWIRGHIFQNALYGIKGGVAQGYVSLEMIKSLPLEYPPLLTQHKIVSILSAYDDLIENNTRRIQILEEMAQALYREWFVEFRFPGHEKVKMVESELGMVPDGWEMKEIGEIIETIGGGTPSTKNSEYWEDGNIIWFSPTDLTSAGTMFITDSGKKITKLGYKKSSAHMFPAYSVMMTSRATIGVVAINTRESCTNQGFITCIPNDRISAYQIYFWLLDHKEKIINIASGATYKEINKTTFRQFSILVSDIKTNELFFELVHPIFKDIKTLQDKNTNLRRTRDLLLPKLISGELDVSSLNIPTGELT